jgi:hypothetical protein
LGHTPVFACSDAQETPKAYHTFWNLRRRRVAEILQEYRSVKSKRWQSAKRLVKMMQNACCKIQAVRLLLAITGHKLMITRIQRNCVK